MTRRSERVRMVTSTLSADAVQELGVIRLRIDDWKFKRDGWPGLEPGLLRTYRRGRKTFRQARRGPTQENLHAWRKRVKDLSYQLRLLTAVCGPAVGGQAKEAHRLADLLGDDHDLGGLRQTLVRMSPDLAIDLDALLGLVDHTCDQVCGCRCNFRTRHREHRAPTLPPLGRRPREIGG